MSEQESIEFEIEVRIHSLRQQIALDNLRVAVSLRNMALEHCDNTIQIAKETGCKLGDIRYAMEGK
jgi:hypothetical protein